MIDVISCCGKNFLNIWFRLDYWNFKRSANHDRGMKWTVIKIEMYSSYSLIFIKHLILEKWEYVNTTLSFWSYLTDFGKFHKRKKLSTWFCFKLWPFVQIANPLNFAFPYFSWLSHSAVHLISQTALMESYSNIFHPSGSTLERQWAREIDEVLARVLKSWDYAIFEVDFIWCFAAVKNFWWVLEHLSRVTNFKKENVYRENWGNHQP